MGVNRIEEDFYSKKASNEALVSGMGSMVSTLLEQGMVKVKKGEIQIQDPNDIIRLWAVMEKVTDYQDVIESRDSNSTGILPEISTREAAVLGVTQEQNSDGEVINSPLDEEEIAELDPEEIFSNLTDAMNKDNADSIKID